MARTRSSRPVITGGTAGGSSSSHSATATPYNGGPIKRGRGRPSKASTAAATAASTPASRDSLSSITTSNDSESLSGYSTPLTSNGPTPAPEKSITNIEVVIPTSSKTRQAKPSVLKKAADYMLATGSKRKRQVPEIADSEEEDDFSESALNSARTRNDEKVARQLQEKLDREAALALVSDVDQNAPGDEALSDLDSDQFSDADVSALPDAAVGASDNEDEDEAWEEDYEPPAKKQKSLKPKAKGKRPMIFDLDDDDIPVASSSRKAKGKTRAKIEADDNSQSGEDIPDSMREYFDAVYDDDDVYDDDSDVADGATSDGTVDSATQPLRDGTNSRRGYRAYKNKKGIKTVRRKLESFHPHLNTMWDDLERSEPIKAGRAEQPQTISRAMKPFQLEGLAWMQAMEKTQWKGGLLGDEMGLGKTIQAVSLIMSDYPAKQPSLVLVPPVALMQWVSEIDSYTDGRLKTLVMHGTNSKSKGMTAKDLKKFDVIMMSYNSLESMYRKQEKGFTRKDGVHKEKSLIHAIQFHRVILDEAHCIKTRSTMTAKACFALKSNHSWCLTGTPLQNRIGEFFSLVRFLNIQPFASYFCKNCPCEQKELDPNGDGHCAQCKHHVMQHISVFNHELLNPIQRAGNHGEGQEAFRKLRLLTNRLMLRRLKKDHTNAMDLPVKEIYVDRQFFGEAENDFANSIMTDGQRDFDTYVAQGVLLNNYANIFGLIMQMRQVADHPDLILKKDSEGGQNILHCIICDEVAEEAIRSRCKHDFCRACATAYLNSQDQPDCPRCHIPLSIDLDQPAIEQDEDLVKKSSIINRIKMENWTSSTKIELLVHELHKLRSDKATHKSIIFSQFTTMLQLVEWRLRRAGISTVMLDGSMTPAQRAASIDHFMKDVNTECFLVSLKAGGVALNLTEASHVFIVDPWWNPAAEWQSADRCHRIGQSRPCTITRLCIEDSVESRMVLLQEKKTSMINSTINSDDAAMESLTPQDLQFLFRGN